MLPAVKIKQTSTARDNVKKKKKNTSLIIYIPHGEHLHAKHAKIQSHNTKKKKVLSELL